MSNIITSINPATGKEIKQYEAYDEKKVGKALKEAGKTFEEWRMWPFSKRAIVLKNIAKELRREKEGLAVLATLEMGKPIQQGRDEVEKCAGALEYYAREGAKFLANEAVATDARKSYVAFRPLGVVLAIMPWNFP